MQLVFIKILVLSLLPEFLSSVFIQSYMLYRNVTFGQLRIIIEANPSGDSGERKKCFRVRRRIRYQRIQEENESGCSCGP